MSSGVDSNCLAYVWVAFNLHRGSMLGPALMPRRRDARFFFDDAPRFSQQNMDVRKQACFAQLVQGHEEMQQRTREFLEVGLSPPVVPFYPFLQVVSPTKIDYRKRVPLF